jgi:type IV pilus assembly protein PilE
MIVVAIVAILAAIAIPAYRSYVLKSNRTDAMRVLTGSAQILQRCYSQTFTFNGGGCPTLPTSSPNNYYTVVNTVTASTFSLTATASGPQASDTTCNSFTLDQTGKESALNSSALDESTTCWGGN